MLFEQAVYEYIDAKQFGRKPVRANTLEGYVSAIRCHLLPKWAGHEIETITCGEIQAWVDSFERVGAAQKAFKTFRQLYRWYLRTYRVRIWDETQAVDVPTAPRRKPNTLTAKQAKQALRDMRPRIHHSAFCHDEKLQAIPRGCSTAEKSAAFARDRNIR